MTGRFAKYCERKEQAALAAAIPGYVTAEVRDCGDLVALETPWSAALFDGPFYRSAVPARAGIPTTSLVFVQSRDGNTVAADPSTLGGGDTDLHLIYEGLSRVDADAVLAGAATARGKDIVFSVWHPQLVALRLARGRPRHPAQVVVTDAGSLRFDEGLMFQEPSLRVFVITRSGAVKTIQDRLVGKPWIDVIDAGEPVCFASAMEQLCRRGIGVLSCVGGPRTAATLLDEQLVQDIYLTTSAIDAGTPGTPYHAGRRPRVDRVVLKEGQGIEAGVRFEHLIVRR
ncbi:MAG: dihydrofolate reductase family protein [Vicinamibacterales bacterium]